MTRIGADAYHGRVQIAIEQAGLDLQAIDVIRLVAWSIKNGRNLPWWQYHGQRVIEAEGYETIHLHLVGLTLGLMVQNPNLILADAAQEAGNEWRQSIRRQWDVGPTKASPEFASLEGMADETNEDVSDLVTRLFSEGDEPMSFDETQISDPRLVAIWEAATPGQREVMQFVANGVTVVTTSEHLGLSSNGAQKRLYALRRKAAALQ